MNSSINLIQLYESEDDMEISKKIKTQWTALGLEDTQLINYSVLLDFPGSSPGTITVSSTGQCFYPDGQPCREEARKDHSQDLLSSYAAYSAKGTLQADVIDVSYGATDDLRRIIKLKNTTNKIALMKLGKLPLLYKISLLEKAGFGGALLYTDPCDVPKSADLSSESFMVTLNPGGDPSTPGYPSLEKRTVSLQVQTVTKFKTVSNVVGYLKGVTSPDRYIIVGSNHHAGNHYNGQEWASSTAIITTFIQALMLKVKKGWTPERTIVFCSWGGSTWGNIGSYEWGEDFAKILQKNAVAYISLHSPIRGNSSLHSVASPSLQQLVVEKTKSNCIRRAQCPGTNVSSIQIQGDADYFINHLAVPAVQFAYEDIKAIEVILIL
ncbi:inactive N-acetylated-alpha-linked acidic dipeptidase-like protein 2 [Acomys russatus]|uniref:inactive N-acetylated-alpha-linked acidic dipeptidase-like protein 2 n=1 Tax=Acomys russatus TaxID=60746 RepID=UPI0021E2C93F|nr:inactive N-acetylated-alpha-linked acidic dipeptidase-like protein 2 [Acomys russatus]